MNRPVREGRLSGVSAVPNGAKRYRSFHRIQARSDRVSLGQTSSGKSDLKSGQKPRVRSQARS